MFKKKFIRSEHRVFLKKIKGKVIEFTGRSQKTGNHVTLTRIGNEKPWGL